MYYASPIEQACPSSPAHSTIALTFTLVGAQLAVVVFPLIVVAATTTLLDCFVRSGLESKLLSLCDASVIANPHQYTGIVAFDHTFCLLIGFFHGALDAAYRPLLADMMATVAAVIVVPFAEAARETQPPILRFPVAIGVMFQTLTFAIAMPIYWLLFILAGSSTKHKTWENGSAKICQVSSEGVLFSLLVGFVIPTMTMIIAQDPIVTIIWQGFPLWMELTRRIYGLLRPPAGSTNNGYHILQATYSFVFLVSATLHIIYAWPLIHDLSRLQLLFMPWFVNQEPATTSLGTNIAHFLKWDMIFGAGSTILSSFWFTDSILKCAILALWHILSTILFGPGAAIAGAFMWRETKVYEQTKLGKRKEQ
ncbi:hypothetical protein BJ138DRAFT_1088209 [Hygrophoropsis aurantiaca]|uniref:Uncharacterized protein n=1 Tax=Hygrophoropsis aurantiaca TaxID=72124 RepID=A0ACB8AAA0_9AGAM|nr:hypothetical protein BJ138DRAFT_1088209 [Hygrophoropsis aurantiaca]